MEASLLILGVLYGPAYGAAFTLGAIILLIFSLEKFDKPYPGNKHLGELLPSSLSPGSSYIKAFLVYFAVILSIFITACLILGTATSVMNVLFGEGAAKLVTRAVDLSTQGTQRQKAAPEIPLIIALLMVGLFPKHKQFGEIEAPIRRFSHRLIGIPHGLEEWSKTVAASPMNTAADHQRSEEERASTVRLFLGFRLATMQEWQQSELASRLGLAELAPPDSKDDLQLTSQQRYGWSSQLEKLRPALRVSEKWYRAKRLVERIFEGRSSVPERKIIDTEARHKYAKLRSDLRADYDQFAKEISAVSDEQSKLLGLIDAIRQASIDDGARISSHEVTDVTDSLQTLMEKRLDDLVAAEERIDAILDKAHLYIAASIILQRSGEGRKKCLSEYGLAVGDDSGPIPVDDVLLAVLAMVGVLFVFNFILYYVLSLTTDADNNPSATALKLAISALLMHGGAAIVAFFWRRNRLRAGKWTIVGDGSPVRRPVLQFVWLGTTVYLGIYAGLVLWTFVLFTLSPKRTPSSDFLSLLPDKELAFAYGVLSLAAVATAVFTALYVGSAERHQLDNRAIALRAVLQGTITGFIVFVASQIQVPDDFVFAITSCLNGFVIGVSLGAAVLKLASTRQIQTSPLPTLVAAPAQT